MAKNTFSVNKVNYTAKPFDFDLICDLEDMGVALERIDKMPMSLIRAYFSMCAGISKEQASLLIQNHIANGGKLDEITDSMAKEMNDSDFFRSLSEKQDEEDSTIPRKASKKESIEE